MNEKLKIKRRGEYYELEYKIGSGNWCRRLHGKAFFIKEEIVK